MRPLRRKAPPGSHAEREEKAPPPLTSADRLVRLLGPPGPELSCAECFDWLDRYVELRLAAPQEADRHVPGKRAHLDGCPACDDDSRGLLVFVAQEHVRSRLRPLL